MEAVAASFFETDENESAGKMCCHLLGESSLEQQTWLLLVAPSIRVVNRPDSAVRNVFGFSRM